MKRSIMNVCRELTTGRKPALKVTISTVDTDMEFLIDPNATGKELLESVAHLIGLSEIWFFGLRFVHERGYAAWLRMDQRIGAQNVKTPIRFQFLVQYFPEDVADELIQDVTIKMFYLQIKRSVLAEGIECPSSEAVNLTSYALQAKYGDYDEDDGPKCLGQETRLVPIEEYPRSSEILEAWKKREGMGARDAMMGYLRTAQDLPTFGVEYFKVHYETKYESIPEIWLGVHAKGVNLCAGDDKEEIRAIVTWEYIRKLEYARRKFVIKPKSAEHPEFPDLIFRARSPVVHEHIQNSCVGNHERYLRRRVPDTIDVRQMKFRAKEEREEREARLRERTETKEEEKALRELTAKVESARELREALTREETSGRRRSAVDELKRKSAELESTQFLIEEERRRAEEILRRMEASERAREGEKRRLEADAAAAKMTADEGDRILEAKRREVDALRRELEEANARVGVGLVTPSISSFCFRENKSLFFFFLSGEEVKVSNAIDETVEMRAEVGAIGRYAVD